MQSLLDVLHQMEELLDRLIENAQKLYELSEQAVLTDEVVALQKAQDEMLTKLSDLDSKRASLAASFGSIEVSNRNRIDEKIDAFQSLNDRFIDNLSSKHSLISFEGDQIKKVGEKTKKPKEP